MRRLPVRYHHALCACELLPRREPCAGIPILTRPVVEFQESLSMLDGRLRIEHHQHGRPPFHVGQRVQLRAPLAQVGSLPFRLHQAAANHRTIVPHCRPASPQLCRLSVVPHRRPPPAGIESVRGRQPVLGLRGARHLPVARLHLQVDSPRATALYAEVMALNFGIVAQVDARPTNQLRSRRQQLNVGLRHPDAAGPPRPSRLIKHYRGHELVARALPPLATSVGVHRPCLLR